MIRILIALLALILPVWGQETERYFEILLGPGDHQGFSIDAEGWTGHTKKYRSSEWLARGYTGVVFRGAGINVTHIRPGSLDATVIVDRHPGRVRFERLTIHAGKRQAIFFGLMHTDRPTESKFRLEMFDCEVVADPPASLTAPRSVWGLFGYQSDVSLERVKLDLTQATEHASYWRGFAKDGLRWTNVHVAGAGSQGCKVRNSIHESRWVEGARIILTDVKIEKCGQPWTWRGPGAFVAEGPGCDIIATRVLAKGGAGENAKTFMIDDASGDFFSATNGARGRGYAAGHVVLRDCGVYTSMGVENLTPSVRVCGNGPGASQRYVAKSVTITGSGLFGGRTQLQLGNIPLGKVKVTGCNTPAIIALANSLGLEASSETETVIPLQHSLLKVSKGYSR